MASIFSMFCRSTSPLLQAFNFSKHGRSPAILTKPSSLSDLSLLSQNPPFGHFTSILFSVSRMPYEEWQNYHHSRLHVITRISASIDRSVRAISIIAAVVADNPLIMCISSPMQMWRELRAESGVFPMPRTSLAVAPPAATVEESSGSSDASDKFELLEKKIVGNVVMAALLTSQTNFSTTEAVAVNILMESEAVVRPMLHTSVATVPPVASAEELSLYSDAYDKSELMTKEIAGNPLATSLFPLPEPSQMPYTGKKMLCVNGWSEMKDTILKPEKGRRQELAMLAEHHPVFKLSFHGNIQKVAANKCQQSSQKIEIEIFEVGPHMIFLREQPEDRSQHDISEIPIKESMIVVEVQSLDSRVFIFVVLIDDSNSENSHFSEVGFKREIEDSPHTFYSFQDFFTSSFRHEDQQKIQNFDASRDERSLWGSRLEWQKLSHVEVTSNMIKMFIQGKHFASAKYNWLLQPSTFWKEWG